MNGPGNNRRLRLKQERGWLAAGDGFRLALRSLSDGGFKLFVWLCLEARRDTGMIETSQSELARALGKSKRAVGRWAAELNTKGVCKLHPGRNQHDRTRFEIRDPYWPYHRSQPEPAPTASQLEMAATGRPQIESPAQKPGAVVDYVATVREWFLRLECAKQSFSRSDEEFADQLHQRGVSLGTVETAMLLGAARKYEAWLSGRASAPISSLRYFEAIVEEAQQLNLSDDYRRYLRAKLKQFASAWSESSPRSGPCREQVSRVGRRVPRSFAGAQK